MSVVRYINGSLAGQIAKDFTRYAGFAPPELFEPPDEPTDPYRRIVRDRIKASLPVKLSEESAADRWQRELSERRLAEAEARVKLARQGPRLTASAPQQTPADIGARIDAALDDFGRVNDEAVGVAMAEYVSEKLDELRDEFRSDIKAAQAHPGVPPPIKPLEPETVADAGSLVSHDSALWQAIADTAQRPSPEASQWSLIVCSESVSVNRRIGAISRASRDEIAALRNELEAAKREIKSVTDALGEAIGRERGERPARSRRSSRRWKSAQSSARTPGGRRSISVSGSRPTSHASS